MLDYVYLFLDALVFSVVVESVAVLVLCAVLKQDGRVSFIAALGTLCTIPYVWFVFPTVFWYSASLTVYVGEGVAFLFEAILYRVIGKLSWRNAITFSFLANSASYFLGKI